MEKSKDIRHHHKKIVAYLSQISTASSMIKSLKDPSSQKYQEKWRYFFEVYHEAIVHYILRVSNWPRAREYQAQDVASLVYEKGLRWSFHRINEGVRFRHVLMQLVKHAIAEYNNALKNQKIHEIAYNPEILEAKPSATDVVPDRLLKKDLLEIIADKNLNSYDELERFVLETIRSTGKIPTIQQLADQWQISLEAAKKRRQRSKERWLKMWEQYLESMKMSITELTYGDASAVDKEFDSLKKV
ncbi:sigma-70 family RNA polymerase sigma factor [Candidatus Uabimicrobium amorphum]|uniref:Uncharacterized protein n=1 Tax=Uabimicrobium amorphum TaxID=2596890 RepID=A0A5S9IMJ7_UABAM|nr:sigma-70 family RNA polymerase sigma factor [Candidatus Uabimicrobium amorphum]BBM84658.1 hypothetical protein UABAM_03019 [Candidatus Uabimicrobium amorphum]